MAFGFDTYGINKALDSKDLTQIFDGFYIADNYFTGTPVPVLSVGGYVGVGLALDLGIVRAGVVVDVKWQIDILLYDPSPEDLKFRISDAIAILTCSRST